LNYISIDAKQRSDTHYTELDYCQGTVPHTCIM